MELKDLKEGMFYKMITNSNTWIIQYDHKDRDYIYRKISTNDKGEYNNGIIRAICLLNEIKSIRKATEREINYLVNVVPNQINTSETFNEYFNNIEPVFKTYI